jgi:hypothetical protein
MQIDFDFRRQSFKMTNMLDRYEQINKQFKKKLIFRFDSGSGFYSELNNMVLAMMWCLENKVQFVLCSKGGKIFTKNRGWQDFFLPFCDEVDDKVNLKYNWRPWVRKLTPRQKLKVLWYKLTHRVHYFTQDVFWIGFKYCLELDRVGNQVAQLFEMAYRFSPEAEQKINRIISSVPLPERYAAIQIRGGDKIQETEPISIADSMRILKEATDLKDVFVLTDDFLLLSQLKNNFPNYNFLSLCGESEHGYFMYKMRELSKEENYEQHIKLLASMEIIRNAEVAVMPIKANPGLFMRMFPGKAKCVALESEDEISEFFANTLPKE